MNTKFILIASTLIAVIALSSCGKENVDPPVIKSSPVEIKNKFIVSDETIEKIAERKKFGTCSLENVVTIADNATNFGAKNNYTVKKDATYKLIGFVTDIEKQETPKTIRMILVGKNSYSFDGVAGLDRPDVATYFKVPALSTAGYQIDGNFSDVIAGEYSVYILNHDSAEHIACPTHETITVN
jgi:hypothetical protein